MRLILLRHGETEWNAEQRLQGQDNSALSERGIQQALRFVGFARALRPYRVVASDLGRTRHTAELIGHGNCPSDARLRELDMGEWTGRRKPDLIAGQADNYHAWRAGTFTPARAETGRDSAPGSPRGSAIGSAMATTTCWPWCMAALSALPATSS